MNQTFEQLKPYLDKSMALTTALILLEWDNETLAPKAASDKTAKVVGILSEEYFYALMNDEVKKLLNRLEQSEEKSTLSEKESAIIKQLRKEFDQLESIPAEEYKAYSELTAKSGAIWAEARERNDYAAFAPTLQQIIMYKKRFATYRKREGQCLYDVLLDDFEPGFTVQSLDRFFDQIKTELVPFIKEIIPKCQKIDKSYNGRSYPVEKQRDFCEWITKYIGFDMDKGVIAESAHPFTTNLHNKDVRITNHFYENNLESSIFSTIHEGGHAIYEMNIDDDITQTLVGAGASMGMHESQSRFYENMIGRSKAFWEPLYPRLKEMYPEQLADIYLDHFIKGINQSKLSLVRTEADELTYPLHILIRYEMEKMIFEQDIDIMELPKLWNDKYERYIGIRPENDKEGILQDIHWACGDFGYFPSYAIGSAIAAQIYHKMEQDLPVDRILKDGELNQIKEYLKEHVHRFGMMKNTNEILDELMNESFDASYYIEYLKDKYTYLYE